MHGHRGLRKDNNMADGGCHGVSLHHMVGAELLPTPQNTEAPHVPKEGWTWHGTYWRDENGKKVQAGLASDPRVTGLLPTPTVMDTNGGDLQKIDDRGARAKQTSSAGNGFGTTLAELMNRGLLPTPTTSEGGQNATAPTVTDGNAKGKKHGVNLQGAVIGLLPTPMSTDIHHADRVQELKDAGAETMASRKNGPSRPNGLMDYLDFNGMLPTTRQCITGHITPERANDANPNLEVILARMMSGGQLPTPTDQDCKNDTLPISQADRNDSIPKRIIHAMEGQTGQMRLSPFFVEEMMGFPSGWTLDAFLTEPLNIDRDTVPGWEHFPQTMPVIGPTHLDHLPWDRKKLRLGPNATAEQCATRYRKIAIKGYGNAIVLQVEYAIAEAINAVEAAKAQSQIVNR
jgi:hypothetical protein